MRLLLIDLSHLFWSTWFAAAGKPIDYTFQTTIALVARYAQGYDRVAVCCDSGPSFRHEIAPDYKANRPQRDAVAYEQARRVEERLDADGYTMLRARGFEADDVIATVTAWARRREEPLDVTIATADKDLLQLVEHGVRVLSTRSGEVLDEAAVEAKFGVKPSQIRDYLALVGDKTDNVAGVPGIGDKRAAALLQKWRDIAGILNACDVVEPEPLIPETQRAAIVKAHAAGAIAHAVQLVTLRKDAPIECAAVLEVRAPKPIVPDAEWTELETDGPPPDYEPPPSHDDVAAFTGPRAVPPPPPSPAPAPPSMPKPAPVRRVEPATSAALAVADKSDPRWMMALEPTSLPTAFELAKHLCNSRMFSAYGSPDAVLAVMLMGRSMGIDSMTALRGMHIIKGRPTLSAQLMVALVLRSGKADYFDLVESTTLKATYVTRRTGRTREVPMSYSMDDAKRAGLLEPSKSGEPTNWQKDPAAMLMARASSRLCRAVYPDVCANVYTPEELRDGDVEPVVLGGAA